MQVFKAFFKIAWKNKISLLIYIGIFMILMQMGAASLSKTGTQFESKKAKIVVFDYDNSAESELLKKYIENKHIMVSLEDDKEKIENAILYMKVDYVLYITEGFSKTGKLENLKRSGTYISVYVDNEIEEYVNTITKLLENGYSNNEAFDKAMDLLDSSEYISKIGETKEKGMFYFYFEYFAYIIVIVLFLGLGPIIMTFNKREISDRTEISNFTIRKKSIQLILGTLVLTLVIWLFFFGLSMAVCGNRYFDNNVFLTLVNSIIYTFTVVGMACIISNFDLKTNALNGIANIISLGMAFLGGVFVPMEFFGKSVDALSKFIPSRWYINAHNLIAEAGSNEEILKCFGVELLFGLAFFSIAMLLSKRNRVSRG